MDFHWFCIDVSLIFIPISLMFISFSILFIDIHWFCIVMSMIFIDFRVIQALIWLPLPLPPPILLPFANSRLATFIFKSSHICTHSKPNFETSPEMKREARCNQRSSAELTYNFSTTNRFYEISAGLVSLAWRSRQGSRSAFSGIDVYWATLSCIELYWNVLSCVQMCWAALSCLELH